MDSAEKRSHEVPADRVRAALNRVLASRPFQHSETLERFLRRVVEHALEHDGETLREYTLAVEVFGRGPEFDPRVDPVVRREANQLRSRLAAYYLGQGRFDRVRIELPTGSFTPKFHIAVPPRRPGRMRQLRKVLGATVAVCLCGMAALAGIRVLHLESPTPSVAVLPFLNLSADKSPDYWSDGITEEITNVLARIPGLRVAARSSAFRFKGTVADVREAGRELGVGSVLEGSVRRVGGRVRITAQLFSTEDGYSLWSANYDRDERDTSGIEADIAKEIARNLNLSTPGVPSHSATQKRVRTAAARDLVLQAHRQAADSQDFEVRMGCYRRAIESDPEYAPAYTGMADEWVKRSLEGWVAPREAMEKAREAVAAALQIDDASPEAHLLSAMVKWTYDWDWTGARREFERALDLNPNDANARMQYARFLALMGDRDPAMTQLDQIRELDPVSPAARGAEAAVYYLLREYDRTIQDAEEVLSAGPDIAMMYYWMGRAYDSKGQLPEARAALETWRSISGLQGGGGGFGMLGSVYARAGRRSEALRLLGDALERAKHTHVSPTSIALLHAGLGEHERAMEWLDRAYQEKDHSLVAIKADPAYDSLREDAGFQKLLKKMKLN
jgi:serine/threonine-protein kinase